MGEDKKNIQIKNRKASFEYHFLEKWYAGLVLTGTEIKSIRQGKASLQEAYCYLHDGQVFIKGMHIAPYEQGTHYNHDPLRNRKLLLNKREIRKMDKELQNQGYTIVPVRLFINERGFAKLEIALARGKKLYDKREDIKKKDTKRDLQRQKLI